DFQGPVAREVDWRPDEKGEALSRTRVLDLLIELERLARKVSADVEEYPVVVMKSLERSGAGEVRGRFNLYAVAPQNANSYVACSGKPRRGCAGTPWRLTPDHSPNGILRKVRGIRLPLFLVVVRGLVCWKYFVKPTHKTP